MDRHILIDRLLWLAIAVSTLGALAVGAYGIQQEMAAIYELESGEAAEATRP